MLLLISSNIMYALENTSSSVLQPQQFEGLYVSKTTIYIAKNSEITINSDVILENTNIKGKGSFVMKSENPKTISSSYSTIANMTIENPTVTKLKGELKITERLTIKRGEFDVSEGILLFNPENIELEFGGSLFHGKESKFIKGDMESLSLKITISNCALAISNNIKLINSPFLKSESAFKEKFYENIFMRNSVQPPDLLKVI